MKYIDFIINNFQPKAFIQDLKNEIGEGWCEDAVLKNFIDYNDLEYQLNYLNLFKGDISKKINEYQKIYNLDAKKKLIDFFKKNNPINKKTIDKNFIKKGIFNLSGFEFDFSVKENQIFDTTYEIKGAIKQLVAEGILFQRIKEYKLIYTGQINFKGSGLYQYTIICFYSSTDKKYHLILLFLEEDGNDQYHYINSFSKKPNLVEIKKSINKKKKNIFFYSAWQNEIKSFFITPVSKTIHLSSYWKKECKKGLNEERVEKEIIREEESFFKKYNNISEKSNYLTSFDEIKNNYIKYKPEKYYKNENPTNIINQHLKEYPNQKFKKFNFFKYIMSEKFNYRNDPKFIYDIIHSKDDLEGLLSFVSIKTQEHKLIAEEIRILKMLRTKDKKFLIKIFNTNKGKLYDLATFYMPKYIFNDPILVAEMTKIDSNIISLIGEKLKKNKKFMKKIWE